MKEISRDCYLAETRGGRRLGRRSHPEGLTEGPVRDLGEKQRERSLYAGSSEEMSMLPREKGIAQECNGISRGGCHGR